MALEAVVMEHIAVFEFGFGLDLGSTWPMVEPEAVMIKYVAHCEFGCGSHLGPTRPVR